MFYRIFPVILAATTILNAATRPASYIVDQGKEYGRWDSLPKDKTIIRNVFTTLTGFETFMERTNACERLSNCPDRVGLLESVVKTLYSEYFSYLDENKNLTRSDRSLLKEQVNGREGELVQALRAITVFEYLPIVYYRIPTVPHRKPGANGF
jgi:hypothetical protein